MKRPLYASTILFLLLALLLTGCGGGGGSAETPAASTPRLASENPSLRGTVIEVFTNEGQITGFYAEGDLAPDTSFDKARITITDATAIYTQQGETYTPAGKEALVAGANVEVLFEGPVQESYPVGATAGEIVILQ